MNVPYSTVPVPVISFFHIHCSIISFFIYFCFTVHTVYCVYSTFFSIQCSTGMNLIFLFWCTYGLLYIVHSFQFLIFFIYLVLCECTVQYGTGDFFFPYSLFNHFFFIFCCCTVHTVYCVYSTFFSIHCSTGMNLIFFILVYVRITLHSTVHSFQFIVQIF